MAPGNRSSLIGVQPLPVITENPDGRPQQPLSFPAASPGQPPLGQRRRSLQPTRSPSPSQNQSHHRRSLSNGSIKSPTHYTTTPTSPITVEVQEGQDRKPRGQTHNSPPGIPPAAYRPSPHPKQRPPPPPPPPRHHSSVYYPPPPRRPSHHSRQDSLSNSSSSAGEKELVAPIVPLPNEDKDWFARRGGWWRVALYSVFFVVAAVGLGVGLSVGLKNSGSDSSTGAVGDSGVTSAVVVEGTETRAAKRDPLGVVVPTGTFAFATSLVNEADGCGDGWMCEADRDMTATFDFSIDFAPAGEAKYQLSVAEGKGDDTPLQVGRFANLTMTLQDEGTEDERLYLLLDGMNKTVEDGDTSCGFETEVEVTIWTQQTEAVAAKRKRTHDDGSGYAISIVQTAVDSAGCTGKDAEIDSSLKRQRLAGRKATRRKTKRRRRDDDGTCGCWYANF